MKFEDWDEFRSEINNIFCYNLNFIVDDGCGLYYNDHCVFMFTLPKGKYKDPDQLIEDIKDAVEAKNYNATLNHKFKSQKPHSVLIKNEFLISVDEIQDMYGDDFVKIDMYNATLSKLKEKLS